MKKTPSSRNKTAAFQAALCILALLAPARAGEFEVLDRLTANGAALFKSSVTLNAMAAPAVSPAAAGTLYFDSAANKFRVSQNAGNYVNIIATGTANYLARFTGDTVPNFADSLIFDNGTNIGIGDASPASLFTVGNGDLFQVDSAGNMVRVRDVAYSWPSSQGAANSFLRNDSVGNLTWQTISGDNLGDHTATTDLNMASKAIFNASSMTITGAGLAGTSPLFTVAGSTLNILANGNVGVGTTVFGAFNGTGNTKPFVVAGSGASTVVADNDVGMVISNTNTTANNTSGLHFAFLDSDATPHYISASIVGIHGTRTVNQYSTGQLAFLTSPAANAAPTEKMRIDAAGNVGIGTAGPLGKAHIYESGTAIVAGGSDAAGTLMVEGPNYAFNTAGNPANISVVSNAAVAANAGGTIGLGAKYNGDAWAETAFVKSGRNNATAGDFGGYLALGTRTNGQNILERVRIDSGGNVGIGAATPAAKLEVAGDISATKWITGGCVNPADSNDIMVAVGPWCVDKYEASVWSTATGGTQYGATTDDYVCNDNGQDCGVGAANPIYARSVSGVAPAANITWFQANMACFNAGKELLPNAVWQAAASGTTDPGATGSGVNCNVSGGAKENTGGATGCVSTWGAEDMIGNVWEWVADWGTAGAGASAAYGTMVQVDGTGTGYNDDGQWNIGGNSYTNYAAPAGWIQGQIPAVRRGGAWGSGASAGVFAFFAYYAPSGWYDNIGFRCGRRR